MRFYVNDEDEEERKKREEEAKSIIGMNTIGNSINFVNYANMNNARINTNNEIEEDFVKKISEANSIINTINQRQNISQPSLSDDEKIEMQKNTSNFLSLLDQNTTIPNYVEDNSINNNVTQSKTQSVNKINKNFEDLSPEEKTNFYKQLNNNENIQIAVPSRESLAQASSTNTEQSKSNLIRDNLDKLKNADIPTQVLKGESNMPTAFDINNIDLFEKKREEGYSGFADFMVVNLMNAYEGAILKPASGLYNVLTTANAFGIRGLEGVSNILGISSEESNRFLQQKYNETVESGKKINQKFNKVSAETSKIDDNFIRTSGQITNVISNMIGNYAIGYAVGKPSTVIQGLTVGGGSAQEVLNENKDNIGQATITGLAKGYVSYLTEKMFDANILTRGESSSISRAIDNVISRSIRSKFGKEFSNRIVGIIGENIEELVEDNVDNLIDKMVNNKQTPDFLSKEWWTSTSETAKVTTLSTLIMGFLGLGGDTFENKEKDMQAEHWINEAQKIIDQEDMAVRYDPNQVKTQNSMEQFYVTQFSPNGELEQVTPTIGKEIQNIEPKLMISPVVVKDNNSDMYKVIDGATGVVLDDTYYQYIVEAEQSFNNKVRNLSDTKIDDINNTINNANYIIQNNIMNMVSRIEDQLPEIQSTLLQNETNNLNSSNLIENKDIGNLNNEGTNYATDKVKTITDQFSDRTEYTKKEVADIWQNLYNNGDDVIYDDNGNIQRYIAIEKDEDSLKISQYDNNDNIVQSETILPQNGKFSSEAINNAIEKVTGVYDENNMNKTQQNSINTKNKSFEDIALEAMENGYEEENIDSPLENRNIETIGKQKNVKAYQYENPEVRPYFQEMAEKIGEDLGYVSSPDNRTSKKGGGTELGITTKAIDILHGEHGYSYNQISQGLKNIIDDSGKENNSISKKLEIIIDDQLRNGYVNSLGKFIEPNQEYINLVKSKQGQTNIEGNEVRHMKKNNGNITQNNETAKRMFKNEIENHKIEIKQKNKISGNVLEINTNIFDGISKKKQSSFLNEYLKNEVKGHDYYVDGEKIIANGTTIGKLKNGTTNFDKKIDISIRNELKANIITNLDNIISSSKIYQADRPDTKSHSFANTFDRRKSYFTYKGNGYEVMYSIGKKNGVNTLYSIDNIKKIGNITSGISQKETSKTPNKVDRSNVPKQSIPQKTQNVKTNKSTVNNKSMQNSENNTQNDEVRYLKKDNSSIAKMGNIKYNNRGIKLGKKEYQALTNAINTDTPNLQKGINYKHYGDYFYIFDKLDFNIYNVQGKIKIIDNETIINKIMKEVDDNDRTTRSIDRLLEISQNGKGLHSSNNINARNKRTTTANGGLSSRTIQKNRGTSNGTTTNIEKSNSNNRAIIENDTQDDGIRYLKNSNSENKDTNSNTSDDIYFAKRIAKNQEAETDKTKLNSERETAYIEQEIRKIETTRNWDDSIPPTKLTDIRKTIEDYLGLGVKKGHFRQHAYGIYKSNRDVIRSKEIKDIDTILHETGHAMDLGNRLKIDKESISDELLTAIAKLGGYEKESRTVKLEEGFAEVIREYSIIPKQAKIDYPQTVAVLEGLRKTDKNFDKFITKVQQQTYNYIHQNPNNRALSNQSIGEQTDKTPLTKEGIKQQAIIKTFDEHYAIKVSVEELAKQQGKTVNQIKANENIYYLTRLANGIADKAISMLSDGYIDEKGNKLMPGLSKLGEILGDNPEKFNDLRVYLVANRDIDYKSKNLKSGLRNSDAKFIREQFKNNSQIQHASKIVYDTLDGVLNYAKINGLITQEEIDNLKESNAFYVPMQRVIENRGNKLGKRGAVTDIIKKRTGSELDVKDVLENIVGNSINIIQQVENNNALKALYKQGEGTGLTGSVYDVIPAPMKKTGTQFLKMWEAEFQKQGVDTTELDLEKTIDMFSPNNRVDVQNKIISFINDDGKRVYLQFYDDVIFNSIANITNNSTMSQVLDLCNKMNTPLRYGATMANLGFAIPNMISDTVQASIYSTAGFIPVVDNALGVLDILATTNNTVKDFVNKVAPEYAKRINNLYTLYQQSGASSGTRLSQERKATQKIMKDIYGTKNSENLGIKEKYKPLKRLLDIMTYIPEISEQSTRFEVFKKNYEYYKSKGTSEMDTRILSALESRDATQDFSRMGTFSKEVNKVIPFSAARIGGIYTFAEKVKTKPKQTGMRIAILTAIAMGIKAMGYDDKEIEELNQRKKDDNFVLKVGDDVVTIKKPQGLLRSIINLAEYIQDLATDHIEEGKEAERLGNWIKNAIMDNMPADDVTGLAPNALTPLIENAINKDFYYNTDIVKGYDLEKPDSDQYYDYNSQLAIWLGKIFNYSPAKIDNLISGYLGGLGTNITDIMDYSLGKMGVIPEQPEMGAEDNAIAKRFIVNVNSNSSSIDEIYNRKTELTKLQNGGTISSEEEKELENIKSALSNISDLNKQIKEIKRDLTMSGTEKAEKIKELQQEKTDTARNALGKELISSKNETNIKSTQFYPDNVLKKNGYSLELSPEQKKEYEEYAYNFFNKYENQGLYNDEKLKEIKTKAKDYAKSQMFQKYKANLVKTK